ncbi:hypothetical protein LZA78_14880 [Sinirhodobacter sp. WL0062]|uniref:DUF805 domain-containing protein n=1 Tax=Rhodobacter flavimaris TaxID=2907145 RepID=A0ABS8YY90_9RHOB|nr:hypothetical protein [Sinirhodobacter sp. WL0062]MCE5974772.1 hypothetical protein [Sinirhodobacter sp. WL0062]
MSKRDIVPDNVRSLFLLAGGDVSLGDLHSFPLTEYERRIALEVMANKSHPFWSEIRTRSSTRGKNSADGSTDSYLDAQAQAPRRAVAPIVSMLLISFLLGATIVYFGMKDRFLANLFAGIVVWGAWILLMLFLLRMFGDRFRGNTIYGFLGFWVLYFPAIFAADLSGPIANFLVSLIPFFAAARVGDYVLSFLI